MIKKWFQKIILSSCVLSLVIGTPVFAAIDPALDAALDQKIVTLEHGTEVSATAPRVTPSANFVVGYNSPIFYDKDFMDVLTWGADKVVPNPQYEDGRAVNLGYKYGNTFFIQAVDYSWSTDKPPVGLVYYWNESENAWEFDYRYNWIYDQAAREIIKSAMKKTLGENAWKIWYVKMLREMENEDGGYEKDTWHGAQNNVCSKYREVVYPDGSGIYSFLFRTGF